MMDTDKLKRLIDDIRKAIDSDVRVMNAHHPDLCIHGELLWSHCDNCLCDFLQNALDRCK